MKLPVVIDLFSGCGGLALGFQKAGFDIVGGVEIMPEACETVRNNIDHSMPDVHLNADICKLDEHVFDDRIGKEGCIVIGGPPCQAYSAAGKGKLKSLGKDRVNTNDPRGYLFLEYLRFVYGLDAKAVIMENVPESTNYGGINIPQLVCDELEANGYKTFWTILNAADFGVPQLRERVFVVAVKEELEGIELPIPTNGNIDYVTFNQRRMNKFKNTNNFLMPRTASKDCAPWVSVEEAFSDLPVLMKTPYDRYSRSKLDVVREYKTSPQNQFQKEMRNWFDSDDKLSTVSANVYKNNKRDFPIFAQMMPGDNYLNASDIADRLFREEVRRRDYDYDSTEYNALKKSMVPPYDRTKFENKWKKLMNDKPSHTVPAHLEKDTYSHIHPWEPRGISVREAARLQSFPDSFVFKCTMGNAYKQIGNAVPPLLAYAIAKCVKSVFDKED